MATVKSSVARSAEKGWLLVKIVLDPVGFVQFVSPSKFAERD